MAQQDVIELLTEKSVLVHMILLQVMKESYVIEKIMQYDPIYVKKGDI